MNQVEEEQLKMEIAHIFESGANEIRILEMVKSFNNRPKQENNLLIPDVSGSAIAFQYDLFVLINKYTVGLNRRFNAVLARVRCLYFLIF